MSTSSKSTTGKQKLLITLIILTAGLLFVSLAMGGGSEAVSDSGVDRDDCLQQGDVWDNAEERCYGSSATRFPQSYIANCGRQDGMLELDLVSDDSGQIILPGSPSEVYRLSRVDSGDSHIRYENQDASVVVSRSADELVVEQGGEIVYDDCEVRPNQPESPLGTEATSLSLNQSGRANGVTITLNSIIGDDRCPVDAVCVAAGDLRVNATLRADGLQEQPNLSTGQSNYRFADENVAVTSVVPSAVTDREFADEEYLVTFWVTRSE